MTAQPPPQSRTRAPLPGYPRSVLITPASHTAAGPTMAGGSGAAVVAVGGVPVKAAVVFWLVGVATAA
ncbi:hypothetical protein [Dietzia psychralcaliphila]|uniref:hypothetical protein n=1 Tax=Dietzia psychralcaliphila TaxID=139021 RepID=UPI000D46AC1C|nr:hypothetical protein [Dietzia psychralcaliphila]PTM89493.1 hypothetical protein C8N39_102336 [Dietzia psychralcaliphila]